VLELRDDYSERESRPSGLGDPQSPPDATNLKAPESVRTVQLVSVLISLDFCAASTDCAESTVQEPWTSTATLLTGEHETAPNEPLIEDHSADFESLLENDKFGPWSPKITPNNANSPILPDSEANTKGLSTNSAAIVALTDIAMRNWICPKVVRRPAGITPCEENNVFHLANLAPSIFIPGYSQAVQGRVKLILTIAKFLSHFLELSGQKARFGEDTGRPRTSLSEPASEETCSFEQKEALKGHLWMSLTNGVKDVESARNLKPLHITRTERAGDSPCRTFEDLLSTWNACGEDDMKFSLEDDFEELHLVEGLADSDEYFSDLYDEVLSRSVDVATATKDISQRFNDDHFEVLSGSRFHNITMLSATSNLACSSSSSADANLSAHTAADTRLGKRLRLLHRTSKDQDFPAGLDSSDSKLNEAVPKRLSLSRSFDMIGGEAYKHAYVSRMHPSYITEENGHSRAGPLVFEHVGRHDFHAEYSIPTIYEPTPASGDQDLISVEEDHHHCTVTDNFDQDIEMPSYENSNWSSLTDIIGGDHLLWQMWTKRRPSMTTTDEDMLEMHAMYAQDPDMRLLDTQKTMGDSNGEDYMLDSETSSASSSASSPTVGGERGPMFHYGPQLVPDRKPHHHFHLHKESSSASSVSGSSRPPSRRKLSRGQSFLKRLSGGRSSTEEASSSSRAFSRDEPRDIEIKRRKTLADYEEEDNDEMLLS
jgi:hypothetical protein